EGVKYAKGLLYDYLINTGGKIFVNDDDETLLEMLSSRGGEGIGYGASTMQAKVLPTSPEKPWLRMLVGSVEIDTNLVGAYNSVNVLAALKVAAFFGVPIQAAADAVSAYVPKNNRSQFVRTEKNYLIEDYYNANPSSMGVALDNLALIEGPKAALLGDMRELGEYSEEEHRKVVQRLLGMDLKRICLVGEEFTKASAGTNLLAFPTSEALASHLREHPILGCTILVKGSRSIRMEKVIPEL
ncbi:MAG: UDP-N-acetylmuramoyl-tripeptide--D-alanyl-D-alanine ligase, partial [Bacteroidales bacterium]|nr:UDP-N-acetylmuramoyl-tripeptide--D-alanyl-D-alanine ligase [Bacteroidales bacterium]